MLAYNEPANVNVNDHWGYDETNVKEANLGCQSFQTFILIFLVCLLGFQTESVIELSYDFYKSQLVL